MKKIVVAILKYLRQQIHTANLTPDAIEGLEVAAQCIEAAYGIIPDDYESSTERLEDLVQRDIQVPGPSTVSEDQRQEADNFKLIGNVLMREGRYQEAAENYSRAIELDGSNPVYYCNRGAAHIKLAAFQSAIDDCKMALQLDPTYSKAHSRLGFAYSAMGNNVQARACYQRALELEPNNESYRASLQNIDQQLAGPSAEMPGLLQGIDFSGLLSNPGFVNIAGQMLADPGMQNVGQQLADRLQQSAESSPRSSVTGDHNLTPRELDVENGTPVRPQEQNGQELNEVERAIRDLPPAQNPIQPVNRYLPALDLAPAPVIPAIPVEVRPQPPVEAGQIGDAPPDAAAPQLPGGGGASPQFPGGPNLVVDIGGGGDGVHVRPQE